jgi:hypothetical protein
MSYCLFQNTLSELSECAEVLEEDKELSKEEEEAKEELIRLCKEIANNFGGRNAR